MTAQRLDERLEAAAYEATQRAENVAERLRAAPDGVATTVAEITRKAMVET